VGGSTVIADAEKAAAIAHKFAESHDNSQISGKLFSAARRWFQHRYLNLYVFTGNQKCRERTEEQQDPRWQGHSLLKNLSRKALLFLTYLFNCCLKLSYFPTKWKHAKVILIPKPNKDHSDPSNFLRSISKVFERVILKRFNEILSNYNLLPHHQCGFRAAHSASHQLNRVVRYIKTNRESQKSTGMVFDVEKAFDSVWGIAAQ
jgi:hypothetical protein